ncbi:MAG TPA: NAD(P)-dependent oxidoreductase [Gemmatimonadaceae bacterium]|jgi:3-hydroxyisobutyrate dehydrogenase|nr:NAD(P)-dependent oxidoreductase [Gemmatimonadaceae bacterium]
MTRVAFLGLGAIGAPMAKHLAKPPFDLTVWNRTSEKADEFARDYAARAAPTPGMAVRDAEFVVTCLPSSREVEEVLTQPDGILSGLATHSILIDCTSGDPATSREIAAMLGARDVGFIDAPVSGGVAGAKAGALTVMVGANEPELARARSILEAFGKKIVLCGPVGSGHAVKSMSNALLAVHVWSLSEALAALAKLGIQTDIALDVINGSAGRSNVSENLFPERVIGRAFPKTFRLALLDKDIGIAKKLAADAGVAVPIIDLAAQLIHEAHEELGEEADHVEAAKVVESRAGVLL